MPCGQCARRPAPPQERSPRSPLPRHRDAEPGNTGAPEWLSLFAGTGTGRALNSTLDVEEGLRRVCHVLTRWLADWCAVEFVDETGQVERACIVHRSSPPRAAAPAT
ncbi:hypothetical protein [Streptomyces sp. DSM 118148]|uniref:hypothetical protein n=1 Tax=Streptomyces sp. DSM 118148 TaxID=3448667 RepID=UPI0040400BA0